MDFILWLQGFSSPALDAFFTAVSLLGSEEFYMGLIPVVYWCVDRSVGIRLGLLWLASMDLNFALKDGLRWERPAGSGLRVVVPAAGYGFPSGHAQGNATLWGYLCSVYPRPAFRVLAVTLVFLVSLSRLYLGVHYPADVLGGVAIGVAAVILFRLGERWVASRTWPRPVPALAALALPLGALALYHEPDAYRIAGTFAGLGEGYLLQERFLAFRESGPPGRQVLKVLLGLGGLVLLRAATRPLFPAGPGLAIRYALMGLWVAWLAPLAFRRLGLDGDGPAERAVAPWR